MSSPSFPPADSLRHASERVGDVVRVTPQDARPGRLVSLDAYRGAIMLLMASNGLGLAQIAHNQFPDSPLWKIIAAQVDHTPWAGCSL